MDCSSSARALPAAGACRSSADSKAIFWKCHEENRHFCRSAHSLFYRRLWRLGCRLKTLISLMQSEFEVSTTPLTRPKVGGCPWMKLAMGQLVGSLHRCRNNAGKSSLLGLRAITTCQRRWALHNAMLLRRTACHWQKLRPYVCRILYNFVDMSDMCQGFGWGVGQCKDLVDSIQHARRRTTLSTTRSKPFPFYGVLFHAGMLT